MEPTFTIATPCLNGGAFLGTCLASVAAQAGWWRRGIAAGEIEHLVLDAGSTDGSVEMIRAHAARARGMRVEWRSRADGGQSAALNEAIARARGRFFGWINADDRYERGALRAVARAARKRPDADVIVARARLVDERGVEVWRPQPAEEITVGALLKLRSNWFAGRGMAQPEVFARTELVRAVGGVPEDNAYSMDHELWCRLAAAGARFVSIERLVATQVMHAGQKTANKLAAVEATVRGARRVMASAALADDERTQIEQELAGIERKIEIAGRWIAAWTGARAGAGGAGPRERGVVDEMVRRAGDGAVVLGAGTLSAEEDAGQALERIAGAMRAGDTLVTVEPTPLADDVRARLIAAASGTLAADHDVMIDAACDEVMTRERPGAWGVDVAGLLPRGGLVVVESRRVGAAGEHPLTPGALGARGGWCAGTWVVTLLRREG